MTFVALFLFSTALVTTTWQMHAVSVYLEVSHAVGGGRGEGHLLSSPAGKDDLQPLHHAPARRHGVVLIIPSQEDGAAPVPGKSKVAEVKWQK